MLKSSLLVFLAALFAFATMGLAQPYSPKLTLQNSGTKELLIAVSPVNANIVWAAGTHGTFLVTTDGGKTWRSGQVNGAKWLQFRGVRAVSATTAYLLSIGNAPADFRIYKTEDGGSTWTKQFTNELTGAFYDCFAFWTPKRGIAHSDSVNGVFPDLRTEDGTTWQSIASNMPPALTGEFSFSSSDTCVATQGEENAWIATGGASAARILATTDGGNTWNAYNTPIVSSPSAGAFTVDFRDAIERHRGRRRPGPQRPRQCADGKLERRGPYLDAHQCASGDRSHFWPQLCASDWNLQNEDMPGCCTLCRRHRQYRRSGVDSRRRHNLECASWRNRRVGSGIRVSDCGLAGGRGRNHLEDQLLSGEHVSRRRIVIRRLHNVCTMKIGAGKSNPVLVRLASCWPL